MHFFLTLNLHNWPWIKFMAHSRIRSNFYEIKDIPMVLNETLNFFFQWPWTCPNNLGSKSWHTFRSAIFKWSKNCQCLSIKKWTGHEFWTFSANNLELARMTLDQIHDTPSCDKQLCEWGTSNVSPLEDTDWKRLLRRTDRFLYTHPPPPKKKQLCLLGM